MTADLRYPIGRFTYPERATYADIELTIERIARLPGLMRNAVAGLTPPQFDTPYRPGGWTVRQVVHHVPDSHVNAYVRTKLALTEDDPVIRPYDEQRWAALPDTAATPVEASLTLLEVLHQRWIILLRACLPDDFERPLRHPEIGSLQLGPFLLQYGWHGEHHVAHIAGLREREGW
ncbi:MAG TPA: putative metal-dependent hydrolase [Gemmatimonadaceae bacterium]|nr:putative metal-dependent hydrolase [Gemmatimonadaceae bacterium]